MKNHKVCTFFDSKTYIQLEELARHYRANSLAHAIRLAVEDHYTNIILGQAISEFHDQGTNYSTTHKRQSLVGGEELSRIETKS